MMPAVKFKNPPIAEVACGVLFNHIENFRSAHVGLFWKSLESEFPRIEEAPPIEPVIERQQGATQEFKLEIVALPPMRRTWLLNGDGTNLIQIQQDRFLFNWKRVEALAEYPSYHVVMEQFERHLLNFSTFLEEAGIGELTFRQFELTYINLISDLPANSAETLLVDHTRDSSRKRFLPEPDAINWTTSYPLPENQGRLHLVAQSALRRTTNEQLIKLEMTARGMNKPDSDRRAWFDLAHEWITRGFVDATSPKLQTEIWGRIP